MARLRDTATDGLAERTASPSFRLQNGRGPGVLRSAQDDTGSGLEEATAHADERAYGALS